MPMLTCNACNKEFEDESERKLHYRSEWHRYNLKRKVAGVPGVTEALFQAKQSAIAEELRHKPINSGTSNKTVEREGSEESEDEWVEVDPNDDLDMPSDFLHHLHVDERTSVSGASKSDDMDEDEELDTTCSFICEHKHKSRKLHDSLA